MLPIALLTAVHLAALGQIETGDNDHAVGHNGEVSRYQILPKVAWKEIHLNPELSLLDWRPGWPAHEPQVRRVVLGVWSKRVATFQVAQGRVPSPVEIYLLWHRPGRVLHPTPAERDRAERFAAVLQKLELGS